MKYYSMIAIVFLVLIFLPVSNAHNVNTIATVQNTGSAGLKVRDSFCLSANWDGTVKFDGNKGIVIEEDVSCDGYTWYHIRWEDGKEGWSAGGHSSETWLFFQTKPVSSKFSAGNTVRVVNTGGSNLGVRTDTPELAWITGVPEGTQGVVVGGPDYGIPKGSSGFWHFWKVDYGSVTGWSAEDFLTKVISNPPSAPRNLVATAGDGYVNLAWDPPSSDGGSAVTNYKIYRGTYSGGETLYYTTVTAGTTFQNTNVQNGVTYYYKITAVNAAGESPFSNEASATPHGSVTVPNPPAHSSPSNGQTISTTAPEFRWAPDSRADYHALYIRDTDTGILVFDSETDYGPLYGTSLTLPSGILREGGNYRWNMRSYNSAGWSSYTTAWTFSIQGQPPGTECWSSTPLTNSELASLVRNHFPDGIESQTGESIWVTAYAVAKAESGGNPTACGDNGNSIGLWQIYLPAHPNYDRESLFDPDYNAEAARTISGGGTNWNPWCTWEKTACNGNGNERYRQWLDEARSIFGSGATHDVSVDSLSITPVPVIKGQSANARVEVSNLGTETETFVLRLKDETDNMGSTKRLTLSPGETRTLNFFIGSRITRRASLGTHRVVAKVDPLSGETNTANNQKVFFANVVDSVSMVLPSAQQSSQQSLAMQSSPSKSDLFRISPSAAAMTEAAAIYASKRDLFRISR